MPEKPPTKLVRFEMTSQTALMHGQVLLIGDWPHTIVQVKHLNGHRYALTLKRGQ